MKDIAYCKKAIESTNEIIKSTETTLRNLAENQGLGHIDKLQAATATTEIERIQLSKK